MSEAWLEQRSRAPETYGAISVDVSVRELVGLFLYTARRLASEPGWSTLPRTEAHYTLREYGLVPDNFIDIGQELVPGTEIPPRAGGCHLVHRPQLTFCVCLFSVFRLEHPESAPQLVQEDDLPVSDARARRYGDPG